MTHLIFSIQAGIEIETDITTIEIEKEIGMEIGTEIVEIAGIGIEKEIEIGVDQYMILRIVLKMRIIVHIATEVVSVYDYQGVTLSQPHQLYQGQYSIGK